VTRIPLWAVCVVAGLSLSVRPAAQQTFRAAADVVLVDVFVRQDGRLVPGLTPADFVVLDNGVRQQVERVDATTVPIDLTVVADLSYDHEQTLAALRRDLRELGSRLRSFDRIRVQVFDDHVRELVPFQPATDPVGFAFDRDGHLASLTDALIMALATPVAPDRRHVVIVRTRGRDTISLTEMARVHDVASSSDAQLHVVLDEMAIWEQMDTAGFQCLVADNCQTTHRFWRPFARGSLVINNGRLVLSPFGLALQAAAEVTGGAVHQTEIFRAPTLLSTFEKAFEAFRESYVLRYVPAGVEREGWHTLTVTVPGHRRASVRARRGYGVDPPAAAETGTVWIDRGMPASLRDVVGAYDARDYPAVVRALGDPRELPRLIDAFRTAGNPWPAAPWREATLALDLAEAALFSPDAAVRRRGLELLEWQARLIQHPYEPDVFERNWHWAGVAMGQGSMRAAETGPVLDAALMRFPNEPRFLLARAIAADQAWTFFNARRAPRGAVVPTFEAHVEPLFRAVLDTPEVAMEARIRLAFARHRTGDHQGGLAMLASAVPDPEDRQMAYLRDLFEGHMLMATGRHGDAVARYRRATVWVPTAQAARVSLMTALLHTGQPDDRAEATALAELTQTERSVAADPWWSYWQGDYRFFPRLIAHLRGTAR
jgi:VWFA-related protein